MHCSFRLDKVQIYDYDYESLGRIQRCFFKVDSKYVKKLNRLRVHPLSFVLQMQADKMLTAFPAGV